MMQFKIGGEELELKSGLSLTFKKTNSYLAFDDIQCERTDSFQIPATPKNIRLLNMSQDIHWNGSAMREKVSAEMVDGTIVQNGYLYIDSYENGTFNAVFVCGENVYLKDIKESGNLSEYMTKTRLGDYTIWSNNFDTSIDSTAMAMALYYNTATFSASTIIHGWSSPRPSAKIGRLMRAAASYFGCTIFGLGDSFIDNVAYPLIGDLQKEDGNIAKPGDTIYLYKNLPEWTLVDLFKMTSALTGKLIRVEGSAIYFDSPDVASMNVIDLTDKVISYGKMQRKVCSYGQKNYVSYDNADDMRKAWTNVDPIAQEFDIDNVNLTEENTLYTLTNCVKPYTLGNNYGGAVSTLKDVKLTEDLTSLEFTFWENVQPLASLSMLTSGSQAGKIGLKELIPQQGGGYTFIEDICNKSTQLEVDVKMSRLEYEAIKPDTLFYLNGSKFTWISTTLSEGTAKITLQKV